MLWRCCGNQLYMKPNSHKATPYLYLSDTYTRLNIGPENQDVGESFLYLIKFMEWMGCLTIQLSQLLPIQEILNELFHVAFHVLRSCSFSVFSPKLSLSITAILSAYYKVETVTSSFIWIFKRIPWLLPLFFTDGETE